MSDTARDESIKLSFPVNAAYVSSARLTASSIANRMGFDIDEIEDIKTAVSEVFTYLIKNMTAGIKNNFEVSFTPAKDKMRIDIVTQGRLSPPPDDDEMSLMMIKAMVDEFDMDGSGGNVVIHMIKRHKASIFD